MADFNIVDFGAVADGKTNCREAIQKAIDLCTVQGGRVIVPEGRFLSGTLQLKSNVHLFLETGAVLISSICEEDIIDVTKDFKDDNKEVGWEGGCFLCAFHEENISITGHGIIYGQGDKIFFDDNADGGFHECPKNGQAFRPRTTFFEDVKQLTVENVTFRDAAFWTLHMAGCENVLIHQVRIFNDERGANNDGIDPDSCKNVVISNCIIKAGDDAIVVKNTAPMAAKYGSCENIVISNCILYSHDSALKIGTETAKAIRHVVLSDCVIRDCSRGIGIWVRDGGVIEDIHIHHVTGNTKRYADCPQRIDFAPRWWGKGEPIFVSATYRNAEHKWPGKIRNISFDHIYLKSESCIFIAGEEDATIENVWIDDVMLTMEKQGTQPSDLFDEQPSERHVYHHDIPVVYARCVDGMAVNGRVRLNAPYTIQNTKLMEIENCKEVEVNLKGYK